MLNFLNSYRFYFSFVSIFLFVVVGVLVSSSLLNFFFGFLIIVLSFFVAYSQSIVSSVLALIGLAGVFSLILFGYGASFLAVLYLAVYIGAVAVFFLFVVMMTDLSDESLTKTHYLQRPTIISVLTCLSLSIFLVYLFFINFNFFENFRNLLV